LDYEKVEKNMKLKLVLISILLGCISSVHATLIDLTPGGFAWNNRPPVFERFLFDWNHRTTSIIAGANINGSTVNWSPFTLFGPNNFSINPEGPNADVGWNLTNTDGYFMQYIWVTGEGDSSQITDHLYRVDSLTRFEGNGFVIIDGFDTITSMVFLGTNTVPDTGTTLFLFGIGLIGLIGYGIHKTRSRIHGC
jgi:VPDSG-CTERM motif